MVEKRLASGSSKATPKRGGKATSKQDGKATSKPGAKSTPKRGAKATSKRGTKATPKQDGKATSKRASQPSKAAPSNAARGGALPVVNGASAAAVFAGLQAAHPDAHCELDHTNPFELIVATVLSSQSTDVAVNQVTPELFRRWPTPAALATAQQADVELALGRLGMFRQKSKNIIGLAKRLCELHQSAVPRTLTELVALPGVGRKTANVVLGVAFGAPEGVVVDTHVQRLAQRLGWTRNETPEKIERDLMALFPRKQWDSLSHTLIFHGRRICAARKPACGACPVAKGCPSAFNAEQVGRKPPRARRETRAEAAKNAKDRPSADKPRNKSL